MNKFFKFIINKRFILLSVFGTTLYLSMSYFHISLWYILGAGIVTGLIFGKVFCRWICPVGLVMEILMSLNPNGKVKQMYQYHKLGCPIAWVSGLLNRYSLFRIKIDTASCLNCGLCDKQCYISTLEPAKFSLYKNDLSNPGDSYTCSKCLKCVEVCPNGSLTFKT